MNNVLLDVIKPKYILDNYFNNLLATAYSAARRLRTGISYAIRVRDDTLGETNIGFTGEKLDTVSMLAWGQRNLVSTIPLGVDGNADGISDGWTYSTTGTANKFVANGEQELRITASTLNTESTRITKQVTCAVGNIITNSVVGRATGNAKIMLSIDWYNGASYISSSYSSYATNTTDATISVVGTAPATTTNAIITDRIYPVNNGDTGSGFFKTASLTISNQSQYVVTAYDQTNNGNHATNADPTKQPRIVNAGIVDRDFDTTKASALWSTFASASGVTFVSNGSFVNTTGWTGQYSSVTASNNTASVLGNGSNAIIRIRQTTSKSFVIGQRLLFTAKVRVIDDILPSSIQLVLMGDAGTSRTVATQSSITKNQWYPISGIFTNLVDTGSVSVQCIASYADAATANGKVMEVQEVVAIDVTEYGQPCMVFDGTNDVLIAPNSASLDILAQPLYLGAVFNVDSAASADGWIIAKNTDDTSNIQYAMKYGNTNPQEVFYLEGATNNIAISANNSITKGIQTIQSASWVNNTMQCYDDSVTSGTTDTYSNTLTSRTLMAIGARNNSGLTQAGFFKGKFTESVISTTTNVSKLESNQKKFFSIV